MGYNVADFNTSGGRADPGCGKEATGMGNVEIGRSGAHRSRGRRRFAHPRPGASGPCGQISRSLDKSFAGCRPDSRAEPSPHPFRSYPGRYPRQEEVQAVSLRRGAASWIFRAEVNDRSVTLEGPDSGPNWESPASEGGDLE